MLKDRKTYLAGLPKKRMGAGALFLDEDGRILIVKPTYKATWEIPGGAVELNESPYLACAREIGEELGLSCQPGRLLCVDYVSETPEVTEALMFIFWGGVLSADEITRIRLPERELNDFAFCHLDEALQKLSQRAGQRFAQIMPHVHSDRTIYLEDQQPVINA